MIANHRSSFGPSLVERYLRENFHFPNAVRGNEYFEQLIGYSHTLLPGYKSGCMLHHQCFNWYIFYDSTLHPYATPQRIQTILALSPSIVYRRPRKHHGGLDDLPSAHFGFNQGCISFDQPIHPQNSGIEIKNPRSHCLYSPGGICTQGYGF